MKPIFHAQTIRNTTTFFGFLSLILASTACQPAKFAGTSARAPKPTFCEEGETYRGANFMFMIDNSGSMRDTDCPGLTEDGRCNAATERELAILKAFDSLNAAAAESSFTPESISTLSIAKFTPEDRFLTLDSFENPVSLTVTTEAQNRSILAESLSFTREPKGDTPYLNALELGQRFLASGDLKAEHPSVLVLITDGEPTDKSPSAVRTLAENLDAKILTIRIRNAKESSDADRRAFHASVIREEYDSWATDSYSSLDEYIADLLALAADISDDEIIQIASAAELEASVFEDILARNVTCIDPNSEP